MNETELYDLFRKIVSKSKRMKRFVVASGGGSDINKNNLGEKLSDVLGGISDGVKYPCVMLLPPVEIPNYNLGWSTFKCQLFFMDKQWNDTEKNPFNNLSQKKVEENWAEMSRSAKDFKMVFTMLTDENLEKGVRVSDEKTDFLERYSYIGNDVAAGVGLTFMVDLFNDCEVVDYNYEDIKSILE